MKEIINKDKMQELTELYTNVSNSAISEITLAKNPDELDNAVKVLIQIKNSQDGVKAAIKDLKAPFDNYSKTLKKLGANLENEIKAKFVETRKETIQTYEKQETDDDTGEVFFTTKQKTLNNYAPGKFTYSAPTTKVVIDEAELLKMFKMNDPKIQGLTGIDKIFKKKTVYAIDQLALIEYQNENGTKDLPTKTLATTEKAGIQYKSYEKILNKPNHELDL